MSGTTTLGFPYPQLTDDPNGAAQIQALAEAVDAKLVAPAWPVGDSSNSVFLTGSDITLTANQNKTILATTFTLSHSQWVILAGKALIQNQSGGASGLIGIYIDVDTVLVDELASGNIWIGAAGNITERMQLVLPQFSVFLAAGSHTVRLRGDRDSTVATHTAQALMVENISSHPCSLTVIV